jgi:ABC-type transport system involved in multi-copper enzyme maturation permease subunit
MSSLVASETRKITSTRLWWGLLVGAVIYTGVQAGFTAGFSGVDPGAGQPAMPSLDSEVALRSVYALGAFTGSHIFALILGVTGMTGEYRYQTITPTFLVSPRRGRVVLAKMAAHVGVGLAYGVAAVVTALVVGAAVISVRGYDLGLGSGRLWGSMLLAAVAVALWTLLGIGIGTLIRNQIIAILLAVLIAFLIEPLLTLLLSSIGWDPVAQFLPGNASSALMSPAETLTDYLPWWGGGLVLLGYTAVLGALGMLLTIRRDVS